MGVSGASVGVMVEELVQSVGGYCDGACMVSFVPNAVQLMGQCASASQGKAAWQVTAEWVPAHCTAVPPSPPSPPSAPGAPPADDPMWSMSECDVMSAVVMGTPVASPCKTWDDSTYDYRAYTCGSQVPPAALVEEMNFNDCAQPCRDLFSNVSKTSCSLTSLLPASMSQAIGPTVDGMLRASELNYDTACRAYDACTRFGVESARNMSKCSTAIGSYQAGESCPAACVDSALGLSGNNPCRPNLH